MTEPNGTSASPRNGHTEEDRDVEPKVEDHRRAERGDGDSREDGDDRDRSRSRSRSRGQGSRSRSRSPDDEEDERRTKKEERSRRRRRSNSYSRSRSQRRSRSKSRSRRDNRGRSPPRQHSDGGKKIFVGYMDPHCDEIDLEECFKKYGPIEDIFVPRDEANRCNRGFGFVTFADKRDALDACAEDGRELCGRRIGVNLAKVRRTRGNGPPKTYVPSKDGEGGAMRAWLGSSWRPWYRRLGYRTSRSVSRSGRKSNRRRRERSYSRSRSRSRSRQKQDRRSNKRSRRARTPSASRSRSRSMS